MYFSKTNKKRSLQSIFTCFAMVMSLAVHVNAEQPLPYGNYPVLRGATNPQESMYDYRITDAGNKLREFSFAKLIGVIDTQNGKVNPNEILTNQRLIDSLAKLQGQTEPVEDYEAKAVELGIISQEDIAKPENANFITKPVTMMELNKGLSKIIGVKTKYDAPAAKQAKKSDLASMIYANKEYFLDKSEIREFKGEVITKSSVVESGKEKTLVTVKLDKNAVIEQEDSPNATNNNNRNNNNGNNNRNNANNRNNNANGQVIASRKDTIMQDNVDSPTVVSYVNIISQSDVPILTPQGITTDVSKVMEGSAINIYTKNNDIIYVEQYSVPKTTVTGVLDSILQEDKNLLVNDAQDSAKNYTEIIKMLDYGNVAHLYKLHPDVKIYQVTTQIGDTNGRLRPVGKEQLSYGQDVSLDIRDGVVTAIRAYVPVEPELDSYVPPQSQLSGGTVLDVSDDSITLTDNNTFWVDSSVPVMKGGELVTKDEIKDGDRVKLYYDDIYSSVPSKIEVEGDQRQAGAILKAKVGPYSTIKKALTLKDVKEFIDGVWVDADKPKSYENIKVRGDIYAKSSKVTANNLKTYNNQEIYAVIAKNQGVPTIEKAKIRLGNSLSFNKDIKNLDYSQNTLNIDNNLVKFDDSTIMVKDGNIIQGGNLQTGINTSIETDLLKDAQIIIQNGSGINFENINTYPYKIYRATLRDVFDYSILLGNDMEKKRKVNHYFLWRGGKWERLSETRTGPRLNFTEQTRVYDHDNDIGLTVDQLREKKYEFNAFGIRPEYFNRQVYVVTKDDFVVSIDFIKAEGYVQVNSQNTMVAKAVGEYDQPVAEDWGQNNKGQNNQGQNNNEKQQEHIKPILIKDIYEYNANTNMLQYIKPITTTDPATQHINQTPVRKLIDLKNASVIYNGKPIEKMSAQTLKDKQLTIIYKQNRDRRIVDGLQIFDAICVIAQ